MSEQQPLSHDRHNQQMPKPRFTPRCQCRTLCKSSDTDFTLARPLVSRACSASNQHTQYRTGAKLPRCYRPPLTYPQTGLTVVRPPGMQSTRRIKTRIGPRDHSMILLHLVQPNWPLLYCTARVYSLWIAGQCFSRSIRVAYRTSACDPSFYLARRHFM